MKTAPTRQYRLAQQIGVHPSLFSAWMNGITAVRLGDERIIRLAGLVDVPAADAFDEVTDGALV